MTALEPRGWRKRSWFAWSVATFLASAGIASPADLAEVRERGSLRVLVAADEDPDWFNFKSGPNPGFEREILEGFARLQRVRLDVVPIRQFEELIPTLIRGEGDVGAGLHVTEERRKSIDFSDEVMPDRLIVVSRRPKPKVDDLSGFRAAKVGVIPGTVWAEATRSAGVGKAQIVELADENAVLGALRSGAITATVMSVSDLILSIRKDPYLQAGLFLGEAGSSAWGLRKQDRELKTALNQYLHALRQGSSWNRLVVKYFGDDALAVLGRASSR
jgi:ABC-type amino acid transport substrate-binding protein